MLKDWLASVCAVHTIWMLMFQSWMRQWRDVTINPKHKEREKLHPTKYICRTVLDKENMGDGVGCRNTVWELNIRLLSIKYSSRHIRQIRGKYLLTLPETHWNSHILIWQITIRDFSKHNMKPVNWNWSFYDLVIHEALPS